MDPNVSEKLRELLKRHNLSLELESRLKLILESHHKLALGFGLRANAPPLTHAKIKGALNDIFKAGKATLHFVEVLESMSLHRQGGEEERASRYALRILTITGKARGDPQAVNENFDRLESLAAGLQDFKKDLEWLVEQAQEAIQEPSHGKKGRPRNSLFKIFIVELAAVWEELTGKRAGVTWDDANEEYKGPFFNFVKDTCDTFDIKYQSEPALGMQIKRVLKQRLQ